MARRGRKRKTGTRTESGQLSRAGQGDKIMEVALAQRARVVGLRGKLTDQRLCTPLGILCLTGRLAADQERADLLHEAGRLYAEGVARYRWAHSIPSPHARSADMSDAPRGGSGADVDPARKRHIDAAYQDAFVALTDVGRLALLAVNDVAVHEREARADQLEQLILGLDSLATHYGLTRRRKSA